MLSTNLVLVRLCVISVSHTVISSSISFNGRRNNKNIGSVICDLCVVLSVLITIWCTFDRAGRSWVKMTRFQRSMKEGETKYHYKRSGNHRPNWRQR